MFIATPGFSPTPTRQISHSADKGGIPTISSAASAMAQAANKENFTPMIADGIKQRRRSATKRYSSVPSPKQITQSTSKTMSIEVAMSTAASSPAADAAPKRNLPNGCIDPPPPKRPRCQSEAPTAAVQRDSQIPDGNIAVRVALESEMLGTKRSSPLRSHSHTLEAMSPKQQTMPNPQPIQQPSSLLQLASLLASNTVSHAGILNGYARSHVDANGPYHQPLAPVDHNELERCMHAKDLKPQIDSFRVHVYRPDLYPSTTAPQKWPSQSSETQAHPRPSSRHWFEAIPSSYPACHIQPAKVVIGPSSQRSQTQAESSTSDQKLLAPSTYPQPVLQRSNASAMDTRAQPAEPTCGGVHVSRETSSPVQHARPERGIETLSGPPEPPVQSYKLQNETTHHETRLSESIRPFAAETQPEKTSSAVSGATELVYSNINTITKSGQPIPAPALPKRKRLDSSAEPDRNIAPLPRQPSLDNMDDETYMTKVMTSLDRQRKWKKQNFGRRQAGRIHQVLSVAQPPDITEALFLSADEAAKRLEPNVFFSGIIVTIDQQPRPLQSTTEFLEEYYDDFATVFIQDAAAESSFGPRNVTIGQLKRRFLQDSRSKGRNPPWNCLELATHVEDGLRPAFLAGEDCRLLTKLKHPSETKEIQNNKNNKEDKAGRRGYLPGWKEVEKWALLAQAGALTEPHQDSHGYNTYITVNQGVIGFGWLANPTAEERAEWRKSPLGFTGGKWRYVVLRPGQTVYFPSGTVHFVFRLAALGDTLAFGGHVLRCSQIVGWMKTLLEEQSAPDVTNEDLTESAPGYLDRVEKFVQQALKNGKVEIWGGKENIEEFLALNAKFTKNQEELIKQQEELKMKKA